MRRAIRNHLRDFLAMLFVVALALSVAGYVLSNQRFYLPSWVPVVGSDFYTVKAELSSAQAVVPGQGQTVNIAGVKVGDIGKVELKDGRAVVEMKIKRKYAPIYKNANILLRPKTGLKDMFLELDPGSRRAGKLPEGGTVRVANTLPDVNTDEILSQLDSDTRAYLRILLNSGGQAFAGKRGPSGLTAAQDLRATFKRFEPTSRDARLITLGLAQRRHNLARVIHNFQELATAVGGKDRQLAGLVDSSNANFQAIAQEEGSLRQSLRLAPGALGQTATTLRKTGALARNLGPTLSKLRPAARALGPSLRATRPFLRESTPIIKNQLRPFARDVRPTVRDLRKAAKDLAVVTPRLTRVTKFVNALLNTLAYNPPGSEEGYLFWASWVNHAGATIFGTQDAHGPVRRGLVLISCSSLDVLEQLKQTTPQLGVLIELLNAPRRSQVCPTNTPGTGSP
jgi:phospholipid/cholesterol/gamma-HCH transport system substrate-binding protein